jgi:hypothetical protein
MHLINSSVYWFTFQGPHLNCKHTCLNSKNHPIGFFSPVSIVGTIWVDKFNFGIVGTRLDLYTVSEKRISLFFINLSINLKINRGKSGNVNQQYKIDHLLSIMSLILVIWWLSIFFRSTLKHKLRYKLNMVLLWQLFSLFFFLYLNTVIVTAGTFEP